MAKENKDIIHMTLKDGIEVLLKERFGKKINKVIAINKEWKMEKIHITKTLITTFKVTHISLQSQGTEITKF